MRRPELPTSRAVLVTPLPGSDEAVGTRVVLYAERVRAEGRPRQEPPADDGEDVADGAVAVILPVPVP